MAKRRKKTSATDIFASESNYLGQSDIRQPRQLTISELEQNAKVGVKDRKPVLHFEEDLKPLIVNKVNGRRLIKWFGDDPDAWSGEDIEVYVDPDVEFGGEITGGLGLRQVETENEEEESHRPKKGKSKRRRQEEGLEEEDDDDEEEDDDDSTE